MTNNLEIALSEEVAEKVQINRNYLENKLKNNNQAYYGINTGFGSLCNEQISSKKLKLQRLESHAYMDDAEIDLPIVKLMLLLEVNALALGYSGVQLKTIEQLIFF